jgi:uncharacterized membrane protein YhaH (DUF805 family)
VTLPEAVRAVLSNYATFSGRAERSEFWWWTLAVIVVTFVAQVIDSAIMGPFVLFGADPGSGPVSAVLGLALLLPNIAVAVRRLHDTDRSGWWILIILIPIVGFLVLVWFYIQPGTPGANRFGPRPPAAETGAATGTA